MAGDSSLPAAAGESDCALPALAAMESDRGRDCRAAAEAGGGCLRPGSGSRQPSHLAAGVANSRVALVAGEAFSPAPRVAVKMPAARGQEGGSGLTRSDGPTRHGRTVTRLRQPGSSHLGAHQHKAAIRCCRGILTLSHNSRPSRR